MQRICQLIMSQRSYYCCVFNISSGPRDFWAVLWKKWSFSVEPYLFLFFIGAQFHVKLAKKLRLFYDFFGIKKLNWLMVSWVKSGIKLWNRQIRSGKKMKLTARGFATAVSFIFFQTECGRFHNFSHLKSWNHRQFHFWAKKR